LEALVAAAAIAVNFVANGVLFVIVLVIIFSRIKFRGTNDLRDDRLFETPLETLL
jgi:hypothetical protein